MKGNMALRGAGDEDRQQWVSLEGRQLALVELPSKRLPVLLPIANKFAAAVAAALPGRYVVIDPS
jgi:hypothetical protein